MYEKKKYSGSKLRGARYEIQEGSDLYPHAFLELKKVPKKIYLIGNPDMLSDGLAIIGTRKASPYGLSCAEHFAKIAASRGVNIISGGAYGCDIQAHKAAIDAGGKTLVFLGGGCDRIYPARHFNIFQEIIDKGGAIASEQAWDFSPLPYTFRERNRLIATLSLATLVVEAGLPSGTFSTADEALQYNREVLVVPGSITSDNSSGCNRLLYQGALPVVDDASFIDILCSIFGPTATVSVDGGCADGKPDYDSKVYKAICAEPLNMDELMNAMGTSCSEHSKKYSELAIELSKLEYMGLIERFLDGRYVAKVI